MRYFFILSSDDDILSSEILSNIESWILRPDANRRIVIVRFDISNNVSLTRNVASQYYLYIGGHISSRVSFECAAIIAFSIRRNNKFFDKTSQVEDPQKMNIADLWIKILLYASFSSKCK